MIGYFGTFPLFCRMVGGWIGKTEIKTSPETVNAIRGMFLFQMKECGPLRLCDCGRCAVHGDVRAAIGDIAGKGRLVVVCNGYSQVLALVSPRV